MTADDQKATLQRYLQEGRDAMLSKLDGLPEYDIRRPMTPTGTNLLGLVKHLSQIELGYFGETFGRPSADQLVLDFEHDPNADLMAKAGESREYIIRLYRQAWEHSDATISQLSLDATGRVPWWGRRRPTSRCTGSWYTSPPRPTGTPATRTSSARRSTESRACADAATTCRQATRPGGRPITTGSSARPARRQGISAVSYG
jgi:hypothetical protein